MTYSVRSFFLEPEQRVFALAVLVLTGLSLFSVWYPRFPAMQDYPQHLFMAHVLSSFDNSLFNWRDYYEAQYLLGPYSLFFLIVGPLANIMPIEIAGKIFISIALCLVSVFVCIRNFSQRKIYPAWSLLMLFPLFFSQVYYMGFTNYLISIPILFLVLHIHERVTSKPISTPLAATYLGLLGLMFLSHPYSVLVYVVLAGAVSGCNWKNKKRFYTSLAWPLITVIIFAVWYANTFDTLAVSQRGGGYFHWIPLADTLKYFLLPFVGMRLTSGVDIIVLLFWLIIVGVFVRAGFVTKVAPDYRSPVNVMLMLAVLGYAVMPFYLGDYSYFNLRMSLICYFLAAIALGSVELGRYAGYAIVVLVSSIMMFTVNTQMVLSAETEAILPILEKMESKEVVAAVYDDSSAGGIDKSFFYQFHAHDHFYYNVVVGGGAASSLFPSNLNPVNLKKGLSMPDVYERPNHYRYILVRSENVRNNPFKRTHELVESSTPWTLFERR